MARGMGAKAFDAVVDFLDDFLQGREIGGADEGREFVQDSFHVGMVLVHERGDIVFVDVHPQKIPLAIEGGHGVKFQQEQAPHGGNGDVVFLKVEGGDMLLLHFAEEGIRGKQDIDLQPLKMASGEEPIPIGHLDFGEVLEIIHRHDQIDILGVSAFYVMQEGDAAN